MNEELVQILIAIRTIPDSNGGCFGIYIDTSAECAGINCSNCPFAMEDFGTEKDKDYGHYLLRVPVSEL